MLADWEVARRRIGSFGVSAPCGRDRRRSRPGLRGRRRPPSA